jgi:4-amino-4-deoxy-L-arabinose transferase-like glycosyltransferase
MLVGAIHITLTLAVFLAGHFQLLPSVFDAHGTGLTFAIDATSYRALSSKLANELQTNGLSAWLAIKAPLHCRLYSLLFATIGRVLGHNVLTAEPLNLFYYLGILCCVYFLGREIFNARAGMLAAMIVAVWPSFLLHSTQLIRDSFAILCLLALVLALTLLLRRQLSWAAGLATGAAGAALVTLFWVLRGNMWSIVVLAVGLTIVLLLCRIVRSNKILVPNILAVVFVAIAMLVAPSRLESTGLPGVKPPVTPFAIPPVRQLPPAEGIFARMLKQVGQRRAGFSTYTSRESDIAGEVRLHTAGDVLKFLPRAAVIGFLAPFPRMWIERGSFGLAGRLLSGAETLVMYFLYLAVGVCVWRNRRRSEMWLLFLVAALGTIALGVVVVNAGALYRLRYVFWIMFIIMAAHVIDATIVHFTILRTNATKSLMSSSLVSNDAMNRHSDVSSFQT